MVVVALWVLRWQLTSLEVGRVPIDIKGVSRFQDARCSSTVNIKAQDAEDSEEISEVGLDWRLRAKIGISGLASS